MLTVEMSRIDHLVSYLCWLTDAEISAAEPFAGWHADYTARPSWGIEDAARNAWHCRYFGELMRESGLWVGPPAVVILGGRHKLWNGNHRIRSCQWLSRVWGVVVRVPVEVQE